MNFAGRYDESLFSKRDDDIVKAVTSASVKVYEAGTTTEVSLYDGREKSNAVAQPIAPDSNGNLEFFAAPGTYDLEVSVDGSVVSTHAIVVQPDPVELGQVDVVHVKDHGATGDGTTDDAAAIQAAIDSVSAGRTTIVRLDDPNGPTNYLIGSTITVDKGLTFGSPVFASTGAGPRLKWGGATGGTMLAISANRAKVVGVAFDGATSAANCITVSNVENVGLEEVELADFTGTGLTVGNGTANTNAFTCKQLRIRGGSGSIGININGSSASEDIVFWTTSIAPNGSFAMARHVLVTAGHVDFYGLLVDDDALTDYGIRVETGSIGLYNLISELKQTIDFRPVGRSRGSIVQRADLRSSDVQTGEYAIKWVPSGNEEASLTLTGVHVKRLSGAANRPDILVNQGTLIANGVWFTSGDANPAGQFSVGATGHLINLSKDSRFSSNVEIDGDLDHDGSNAGFFGTAPAAQPSLTYSRTGETTPEAQLRSALSTLGLVADNTTA